MIAGMDRLADITIIGAGIVGLAVAAELAATGREVVVLERHESFGRETSSRNSEVIHAGLYYEPDSLKARLCVEGRERIYALCRHENIGRRRLGKLVVACTAEESSVLAAMLENGRAAGVDDLSMLGPEEVRDLEPEVRAPGGALYSPSTGIVDSHALMAYLARQAENAGATLVCGAEVVSLDRSADGSWQVGLQDSAGGYAFESACVVNSAGLGSEAVARMAGIDVEAAGYRLHYCKGEYFSLAPSTWSRVSRLVYPAPPADGHGVGTHLTLALDGRARLGPNAYFVESANDFEVNVNHRQEFFEGARSFLPFLEIEHLTHDTAGIRPKLAGPGAKFRDFVIRHEADRGLEGLINLVGIESPGLTASLALGALVREMVDDIQV